MALQTPQRPLPGAYFNTPAASRLAPIRRPTFTPSNPPGPVQPASSNPPTLQPVQRAARTINEVLQREANFPDLDSYVRQGISSEYQLPNQSSSSAWSPFQKAKSYEIPQQIFEQYDGAQVSTFMGLFAEISHAWVAIDSSLYLWDYTAPNPEIIGYEEQSNSILSVKLLKPRKGVFVNELTHVLVVATTAEIILLGVGAKLEGPGIWNVSLYQTGMSLNIRGVRTTVIEGSAETGRIFFGGGNDNEIYELTYQQEEKWFASRCGKINHTNPGYKSVLPNLWGSSTNEKVEQIVVDDTRGLVYALSSASTIRTFHMDSPTTLTQVIEKTRQSILRDTSHMFSSPSILLPNDMKIISISAISAKEGSKLHLMATTSTGVRFFLSATRGYGFLASQGAPQSMQVQHVKFPPSLDDKLPDLRNHPHLQGAVRPTAIDTSSRALDFSRLGYRFPPGFFFCFLSKNPTDDDVIFASAPDTGKIAVEARSLSAQPLNYFEQGCWVPLTGKVQAVGLATAPFAASNQPLGFGNELAVQYDEPPTDIAILTTQGIYVVRRRRLVDMFAAAIRNGGGDERLEAEINKFIDSYGRGETSATALAVACGQGSDTGPGDLRIARTSDPETLRLARQSYIEYGSPAQLDQNMVSGSPNSAIDNVRPSSRHEGLALYIGRLIRSLWKTPVIQESIPQQGQFVAITSRVKVEKLISVQDDLGRLKQFLEENSSFIEGLAGPESLQNVANLEGQIALQGEHRALHSLQQLNHSIIEGISFVQMLFEERMDQIWATLEDSIKQRVRELTYEQLFSTDQGKDLAKILVKAIVNRNISQGSNVDTVADALRRRCGSFCSPDDVIIFKAQEQLKKAADPSLSKDTVRNLLNESLRLFLQVASALSLENLQSAMEQFSTLHFYAGAINLALLVASESDRGNTALAWVKENKPHGDARQNKFNFRSQCYDLVHRTLLSVDDVAAQEPDEIDGRATLIFTKRTEAYTVVNESEDELFQYGLYEWYLQQGWVEKLLATDSPFVSQYLTSSATENVDKADLLWKFYVHQQRYYEAASVQLELAKSDFNITLAKRIEYLSRAKANASTSSAGIGRQARQVLLYEISELLDVANIQDEILSRLRFDARITEDRRPPIITALDGRVLNLTELYNTYADQASYFDICLMIYECADHRNDADISATWQQLIEYTHTKAESENEAQKPYEAMCTMLKDMADRLNHSESTFNPSIVIPMIEKYAIENQRGIGSRHWVPELFIQVGFPHESIVAVLQSMWYNNTPPFTGTLRSVLAEHVVYVCEQWYEDCIRSNTRIFGSDDNAHEMQSLLGLLEGELGVEDRGVCQQLRNRIGRAYGGF